MKIQKLLCAALFAAIIPILPVHAGLLSSEFYQGREKEFNDVLEKLFPFQIDKETKEFLLTKKNNILKALEENTDKDLLKKTMSDMHKCETYYKFHIVNIIAKNTQPLRAGDKLHLFHKAVDFIFSEKLDEILFEGYKKKFDENLSQREFDDAFCNFFTCLWKKKCLTKEKEFMFNMQQIFMNEAVNFLDVLLKRFDEEKVE